MAEEKLLTVRDVSLVLGISEKEVVDLAENGVIPAYKVGGVYLRFKRQQVEEFRKSFGAHPPDAGSQPDYPLKDRVSDFFYFNDFYIVSILIAVLLLAVIFRGS